MLLTGLLGKTGEDWGSGGGVVVVVVFVCVCGGGGGVKPFQN